MNYSAFINLKNIEIEYMYNVGLVKGVVGSDKRNAVFIDSLICLYYW
jgi:hypothetical protein